MEAWSVETGGYGIRPENALHIPEEGSHQGEELLSGIHGV